MRPREGDDDRNGVVVPCEDTNDVCLAWDGLPVFVDDDGPAYLAEAFLGSGWIDVLGLSCSYPRH